jgi:hypothetical protein
VTLEAIDPTQRFQEFFKKEKYRQRIAQLAISGKNSLTIEFEELYGFDQTLAELLLAKSEEYLQHASKGAYEQLRIEDGEYAQKIEKIIVRVVKLLAKEQLRKLGSKNMSKLVMVEGIIVRATPVRPMVQIAAFKCKRCGTMNYLDQNAPRSMVVIDNLTDLVLNSNIEINDLVAVLRGMQRIAKKWNGIVYLVLTNDIMDAKKQKMIMDSVDGSLVFEWSRYANSSKRQRYMYVEKFISLLPHLDKERIARFATVVTAQSGLVVIDTERIM